MDKRAGISLRNLFRACCQCENSSIITFLNADKKSRPENDFEISDGEGERKRNLKIIKQVMDNIFLKLTHK